MNISFGQLFIVIIVLLLLFGNLPKITNDIIKSVKQIKKEFDEK